MVTTGRDQISFGACSVWGRCLKTRLSFLLSQGEVARGVGREKEELTHKTGQSGENGREMDTEP